MSTDGSAPAVTAIEIDMRDLLRAKKARVSDVHQETGNDSSFLVSQISGQSVHEIDHFIEGLQGVREKLNSVVTAFTARSCNMRRLASR